MTTIIFILGLVMLLDRENVSWKIFMVLFEVWLSIEIIITMGFWVSIWHIAIEMEEYKAPPRKLALIMNHSVPLICLLFDYSIN